MSVMVSILTLAYNHEPYIAKALESFVMQKTDFDFEVIVHDDASTDKTAEIIRQYAEQYPDIIKPILQTENQYSKGVDIHGLMQEKVQGRYIALCEGDDYWCDENKLQRQIEFLESHPDYVASVHNTRVHDMHTGEDHLMNQSRKDYDIAFDEIIRCGGSGFQTSSLVYRKEIDDKIKKNPPSYLMMVSFTDFTFAIYLSTQGRIRYFKEIMSVYRIGTQYSWTNANIDKTPEKLEAHDLEEIAVLKEVDRFTRGKYTDIIKKTLQDDYFRILKRYLVASKGSLSLHLRYFLKISNRDKVEYIHWILGRMKRRVMKK